MRTLVTFGVCVRAGSGVLSGAVYRLSAPFYYEPACADFRGFFQPHYISHYSEVCADRFLDLEEALTDDNTASS